MYDPDEQVNDTKVDYLVESPVPEGVTGLQEKSLSSGANKPDACPILAAKADILREGATRKDSLAKVSEKLKNPNDPNRFGEAQSELEGENNWSDATRHLALEINQADQELRGESPLTFDEAINQLSNQASLMQEDGRDHEFGDHGATLEGTLRRLGAENDIDMQLQYVNDLLVSTEDSLASWESTKQRLGTDKESGFEELTREDRAIRDALLRKSDELIAEAEQTKETREIDAVRSELKGMPVQPSDTEQRGASGKQVNRSPVENRDQHAADETGKSRVDQIVDMIETKVLPWSEWQRLTLEKSALMKVFAQDPTVRTRYMEVKEELSHQGYAFTDPDEFRRVCMKLGLEQPAKDILQAFKVHKNTPPESGKVRTLTVQFGRNDGTNKLEIQNFGYALGEVEIGGHVDPLLSSTDI